MFFEGNIYYIAQEKSGKTAEKQEFEKMKKFLK